MQLTPLWRKLHQPAAQHEYRYSTHRAVPPEDTLRRIGPLLEPAGITRLADVTGLDFIGIPVYQAIRPNSRNMSVSQGKGLTREQAKVSALMESLEFFHAEQVQQTRMVATLGEMRPRLAYDPVMLLRPAWGALADDLAVEWVEATQLITGEPTWLPVHLCEMNAVTREHMVSVHFLPASNGLASGNTHCEAVVHSLCELIERDAVWRDQARRFDPAYTVPLDSISSELTRGILDKFLAVGARIHVHAPRTPTGLPCFEVFLESEDIPHITFFGAGCSPRRETALIRALTEVAQSRVTHIAGSRDDLDYRHYPAEGELPTPASGPAWPANGQVSFDQVDQLPERPLLEELEDLAARVHAQTGIAPMAIDLSRPDFDLPVVYVVAPGLRVSHYEGVS